MNLITNPKLGCLLPLCVVLAPQFDTWHAQHRCGEEAMCHRTASCAPQPVTFACVMADAIYC